MSKKTVKFDKQLKQATRKGRDVNEAKAIIIPSRKVIGDGLSKRGGKFGTAGQVCSLPRDNSKHPRDSSK